MFFVISFFSHGGNVQKQSWFFRIGRSTMYKIIPEVSTAINAALGEKFLAFPSSDQWKRISENFYHRWNIPNCLGALDGKHIRLKNPAHGGSLYYNYKKFYSIVLMACCDAFGRFTWLNCGSYGTLYLFYIIYLWICK